MKIYVTGLGVVSGIGIGVSENIEALRQGKHGIGKVTLFPTALDVPVSEVKHSNEELKQLLGIPPQRTVSRTALLGSTGRCRTESENITACTAGLSTVTYRFYFCNFCRRHGFKRAFL